MRMSSRKMNKAKKMRMRTKKRGATMMNSRKRRTREEAMNKANNKTNSQQKSYLNFALYRQKSSNSAVSSQKYPVYPQA